MGKRFGSTIRIILALFLSVFMTNFAPTMTAYAATDPTAVTPEVASEVAPLETEETPAPPANDEQEVITPLAAPDSVQLAQLNLPNPNCLGFTNTHCAPATTTVTPKAPQFDDICGTRHDEYTVPYTHGAVYEVNGNTKRPGSHDGRGTVTITAHPASADYVLNGTDTWTFKFTNKECVSVYVPDRPCVENGASNGKIKVKVTNNHEFGAVFKVAIDGTDTETHYLSAGESQWYTFYGYEAGTYHIKVKQITHNDSKTVYEDCFTLDECPCDDEEEPEPVDVCPDMQGVQTNPADCAGNGGGNPTTPTTPTSPGQVLGTSTGGHILSTSTTVPNVLPNTGASATNPWLTIVAAAIAFLAVRTIIRKKLISDQL